jgi:predicted metal-dependent enzyme (double-stranded beta helix superfamily)
MTNPVPLALKRFIWDIQSLVELDEGEREILFIGRDLMARLIASDDWLPEVFAAPNSAQGQQYQLYADGLERFSVVSTVLAVGQSLPIRQQPFWEIAGQLRGGAARRRFRLGDTSLEVDDSHLVKASAAVFGSRGADAVQIANDLADEVSITIHVYGGDIGKLSRREIEPDGSSREIVSGYANGAENPPYDIWTIQTEIID